jgi:hypothetical protein
MSGSIKIGEWEVRREVKMFNLRSAKSPINCIKIMETSAKNAGSTLMLLVDMGDRWSLCVVNDQPVGNPKRKV